MHIHIWLNNLCIWCNMWIWYGMIKYYIQSLVYVLWQVNKILPSLKSVQKLLVVIIPNYRMSDQLLFTVLALKKQPLSHSALHILELWVKILQSSIKANPWANKNWEIFSASFNNVSFADTDESCSSHNMCRDWRKQITWPVSIPKEWPLTYI